MARRQCARIAICTALTLLVAGCAPSGQATGEAPAPAAAPFLVGPEVGGVTHERSPDLAAYKAAVSAMEPERETLLASEYEYGPPDYPGLPARADDFIANARLHMIPVYELVEPSGETTSVLAQTRFVASEYVCLVSLEDTLVGAYDWSTEPVYGGPRHSFYAGLFLDFPRAEQLLKEYFGGNAGVRIVKVPRGYWVVGSNGWHERAAFVRHQGFYEDDPPDHLIYTPQDVFDYGNRHADGG